jgi:hypothetical protein
VGVGRTTKSLIEQVKCFAMDFTLQQRYTSTTCNPARFHVATTLHQYHLQPSKEVSIQHAVRRAAHTLHFTYSAEAAADEQPDAVGLNPQRAGQCNVAKLVTPCVKSSHVGSPRACLHWAALHTPTFVHVHPHHGTQRACAFINEMDACSNQGP